MIAAVNTTIDVAAIILALGGILGLWLGQRKLRQENSDQHGEGQARVAAVGEKLDQLIERMGEYKGVANERHTHVVEELTSLNGNVVEIRQDVKALKGRVDDLEDQVDDPPVE
jgi:polyhydroxyalkanoate synthesis regulator phasin